MLPPAIALFSSLLKEEGHKVEIFDTYYSMDHGIDSDGSKMENLNVMLLSIWAQEEKRLKILIGKLI